MKKLSKKAIILIATILFFTIAIGVYVAMEINERSSLKADIGRWQPYEPSPGLDEVGRAPSGW